MDRKRRRRLSQKAKQRAENILLAYPRLRREYNDLLDAAMTTDPDRHGSTTKPLISDPTAEAAIRLADDRWAENLKKEIEAVELALKPLNHWQREVIRLRYWDVPPGRRGRTQPYTAIIMQHRIPYCQNQMINIVGRVRATIAAYLGER